MIRLTLAALIAALPLVAGAQSADPAPEAVPEPEAEVAAEPPMTLPRLIAIVQAVDPEALVRGTVVQFTVADVPVLIITDPVADRMRAMVPIRSAEGLEPDELMRLMQANFDTALDARYAVARGRLWGVYIHPLSPLKKNQLLSGLAQTVAVAQTYGTLYSGGAVVFGGGDSDGIYRDLLRDLLKKGEDI
ncbi:hypothetical protein [Pseudaestuariivita atlantica]|uniref:Uncharacterized protein n=1 Tax=Pseudaestuariivita atlantica TaxID=1317121 RepID=A0A0L1JTW5_9RHOB|nr:hypothetical protein [Pseudaestuariivita atlantica]KNG95201.1 hypothetical protein ATO11_00730 [Pseudaestuariivita atlantica]